MLLQASFNMPTKSREMSKVRGGDAMVMRDPNSNLKFFLIQLIMYAWKLDFVMNVEDGSFIFNYYKVEVKGTKVVDFKVRFIAALHQSLKSFKVQLSFVSLLLMKPRSHGVWKSAIKSLDKSQNPIFAIN